MMDKNIFRIKRASISELIRRLDFISKLSFTIAEILIVLGIVSALSTAVVFSLNPSELINKARDSQRVSDMGNLRIAVLRFKVDRGSTSNMGSNFAKYISIPDSSPTCSNLDLPNLPVEWSYHCVSPDDLRKTSGAGWVPVNFDSLGQASVLSVLPVDPINSASLGLYYSYVIDGQNNFILSTGDFESSKYSIGGSEDKTSTDNGNDDYDYEVIEGEDQEYSDDNIVLNTNLNHTDSSYNPGWDVSENGDLKPDYGFSSGYDGSVPNPSVGYHAHINDLCGIGHSPCLEMVDRNGAFGHPHRNLSMHQTWSAPAASMNWADGTKLRAKFMAMVDTTKKQVRFGIWHWSKSLNDYTFGQAIVSKKLSDEDDWEKVTQEFVIDSDWDLSSHDASLYLIGNDGDEGALLIDNVQLTYTNR